MTATPEQHTQSRITRAGAIFDTAAALPASHQEMKRRLFDQAWKIAVPQFRALARRALNGDQTTDVYNDVLTYTAQKTWRSVQTGYQPEHGYESILSGIVARSAATVLDRYRKHRDNPMLSLDVETREGEDLLGCLPLTATDDHEAVLDDLEHAALVRRLHRAAARALLLEQPIAAEILRLGLSDTNAATARAIGATPKDVATALEWIRNEQYALLTASEHRFDEYLEEIRGLPLFTMAVSA